MALKSTSL